MNSIASLKNGPKTAPGFREFVALMATIMAMVALAIDSMLPALPAIGESFGIANENHRQYVIASFLIGFGIGMFVMGTLSDRFGRRGILLLSVAGYAGCSVAAAFAPDYTMLLVARLAQGACAAGGRVLVTSIVRDQFVGRQMARVMSLAFIVFLAAPIFAPALGQGILLIAPWRWIFIAMGLIGTSVLIWIIVRLPETLAPEKRMPITAARIGAAYKLVLGERQSLGYTIAGAILSGGLYGFINSVQQIIATIFKAPHLLVPVFSLVAVTMGAGSLINSRIVVRLGMRRVGHSALLLLILITGLHLLLTANGFETIVIFAILQALTLCCFSVTGANFGALAMENVGSAAGTASSVQGSFSTLIGAAIGIMIGQNFNGTSIPLHTGFFLCGLCGLAVIFITERGKLFRAGEAIV